MGRGKKNTVKKVTANNVTHNDGTSSSKSDDGWSKDDEIRFLKDELLSLRARVDMMENEITVLKTDVAISSTVNSRLVDQIDKLETYSRRNCVVLSNVPANANESPREIEGKVKQTLIDSGISKDIVRDIDKLHPIGEIHKNKQKIIIRFNSHSKRYTLYRNKKKLPPGLKLSPSLTKKRQNILSEAMEMVSSVNTVNFVFADIHGDLKVRLTEADKNGRFVLNFTSIDDLAQIIRGLDYCNFDVGSESDSDSEI